MKKRTSLFMAILIVAALCFAPALAFSQNAGMEKVKSDTLITSKRLDLRVEPPVAAVQLVWISPLPEELGEGYRHDADTINIKVRAVADCKLNVADFSIYRNGALLPTGGKANTRRIVASNFAATVPLLPGRNEITVECLGKRTRQPLVVDFRPGKPDLYLISIGVPQPDLKFTTNDARDFANAFRDTGMFHQVFGKVEIMLLDDDGKTTASNIRRRIEERVSYFRANIIKPNDLFILFISTHGEMQDGKFYLLGSDFARNSYTETTVEFEKISHFLDGIQCKKVVFLDACHSGGAKARRGLVDTFLNEIGRRQNGTTIISSSTADENSQEDTTWQNGAFTEALLEGLAGAANGASGGDYMGKKDSIIRLGELYAYVRRRVPELTKAAKKPPHTPTCPKNTLSDIPILFAPR